MAVIELDRKCFEVKSNDGVIRYGWVIDNGDGKWVAITAAVDSQSMLAGFYDTPRLGYKALVELEKGKPWAKDDSL